MNDRTDDAIDFFNSGLNCAQSVLTAFADELNIDTKLALGISTGFGGGIARMQETCGAVTGACMVIGLYNSPKYLDNTDKKEHTYTMIQEFCGKFKSIHGSINCFSLINCDLKTPDGRLFAEENGLFKSVCEKCVTDSVSILEELLNIE